ncbi:MAG: gamma-glutamyl-gamma-aminobutyrate hydrolase family protein [Liquorilactobacillus nagelii]|uniref:gamma-glutamyl-gamma-aminobutyrate hydrolase family protein n=1 Tax=Liquorilactobacillus TaxID=2767888 RepID=UPI0021C408C9|nr:gamma-glutamyl-gamma-aminobutyrate hydrolase family protein [Liquorilactobacillus satsumensis]
MKPKTWLAKSVGEVSWANSRHHQAIKKLGNQLKISANAPDGVVEGIETENGQIMGVQRDPENLYQTQIEVQNLFQNFLKRSELDLQTVSTKEE